MSVFDKFLDIMKLNDDEEEDDFYEDEDYDESYEEKPRHSFFGRKNKEESEESEDYESGSARQGRRSGRKENKVMPIRHAVPKKSHNMEVCVTRPVSVENSRNITEMLLSDKPVILNLEGMDLEVAQRIIDFVSGAAFALNGNLQKISNYIFLATPENVDITGDLQDLLSGSMESASMKNKF